MADGAIQFVMPEAQPSRMQIAGLFRSVPHLYVLANVCRICRIETNTGDPRVKDAGVLPGQDMWTTMVTARKQIIAVTRHPPRNSEQDSHTGLLGEFESNQTAGFLLHTTMARFLTLPPAATSPTCKAIKSQLRHMLSTARLRSLLWIWSRMRMTRTFPGLSGGCYRSVSVDGAFQDDKTQREGDINQTRRPASQTREPQVLVIR